MLKSIQQKALVIQGKVEKSRLCQLFIQTFLKWQKDNCLEMGAALSYYALFSLFPVLLVILSIVGYLLGPNNNLRGHLLKVINQSLPPDAAEIISSTLQHLNTSSVGAGLIGFALLFFTASRIFGELDRSVDKIWQVHEEKPDNQTWLQIVIGIVIQRVTAFVMVVATAMVLTLSLLSSVIIKTALKIVSNLEQVVPWLEIERLLNYQSISEGIALLILMIVVMTLFRVLPSTKVHTSDIWLGSLVTVVLFTILRKSVGTGIVQLGEQFRAYGAIGGVMILLLWLYLTCQIFFIGCEFTYAYTYLFGSRRGQVTPSQIANS